MLATILSGGTTSVSSGIGPVHTEVDPPLPSLSFGCGSAAPRPHVIGREEHSVGCERKPPRREAPHQPLAALIERNRLLVLAAHSVVRNELFHHREETARRIRALPGCEGVKSINLRASKASKIRAETPWCFYRAGGISAAMGLSTFNPGRV
jgi:hypothetical protein